MQTRGRSGDHAMTHLPHTMRLVGQHDPVAVEAWTLSSERSEVERENIAAAGIQLPALDPRWQLASHAYSQLQEGPLTPDQRSRLIDQAATMGMRTFDASLIIAIAQDHARNGRPIQDAAPTLNLVRMQDTSRHHGLLWAGAAACAAVTAGLMLLWIVG